MQISVLNELLILVLFEKLKKSLGFIQDETAKNEQSFAIHLSKYENADNPPVIKEYFSTQSTIQCQRSPSII